MLHHFMNMNISKECRGYRVVSAFEVLMGKYSTISHPQQQRAGL